MLFISWFARPSSEDQASYLKYISPGLYNYDEKHRSATEKAPFSKEYTQELAKDGYAVNHARIRLGYGLQAYQKGKNLLNNWGHFQLKWAWVDPSTSIKAGERFCVCSQELMPWVLMPLEILYVNDQKNSIDIHLSPNYNPAGLRNLSHPSKPKAAYCFGSGTLQGHLLIESIVGHAMTGYYGTFPIHSYEDELAGEERFCVELDDDDNVWFEIFSFSRPAHFLSLVAQPYVRLKQKLFAQQSTQAMLKAMSE